LVLGFLGSRKTETEPASSQHDVVSCVMCLRYKVRVRPWRVEGKSYKANLRGKSGVIGF